MPARVHTLSLASTEASTDSVSSGGPGGEGSGELRGGKEEQCEEEEEPCGAPSKRLASLKDSFNGRAAAADAFESLGRIMERMRFRGLETSLCAPFEP